MIKREELIRFAKFLDEGCDLLGIGYIEIKTDDYLKMLEKERVERQEKANNIIASISKEEVEKLLNWDVNIPKGWVSIEDHLPMMLAKDLFTGTAYKVKDKDEKEFVSIVGDHSVWYYEAKELGITHWWNE
jgi:hypothetical protein